MEICTSTIKCAHILSLLASMTPLSMVKPKPRTMSAISRKYPRSSQSIYIVEIGVISLEFSHLKVRQYYQAFTSRSYLNEHLTRFVKILDYNWAKQVWAFNFIRPSGITTTATWRDGGWTEFRTQTIILANQLKESKTRRNLSEKHKNTSNNARIIKSHYPNVIKWLSLRRDFWKFDIRNLTLGSSTCLSLSACLFKFCKKIMCLIVRPNKASMLNCNMNNNIEHTSETYKRAY